MAHGKSNPKKGQASLGKALQRRRAHDKAATVKASTGYDVDGSEARGKLTSVLEANSLDDFIASAMMSERAFESHRESTVVLGPDGMEIQLDEDGEVGGANDGAGTAFAFEHLNIPRRPGWVVGMTADELDLAEKKSFLEWRRDIASAEESNSTQRVTPFEKNIEVWRQLWRVMERSDLIVQLVDARNPLFYFSTDLEAYCREMTPPKPVTVLVNKSDFLSPGQQREWAQHFKRRGVQVLFFSARQEQERLNQEARAARDKAEAEPEEEEEGSERSKEGDHSSDVVGYNGSGKSSDKNNPGGRGKGGGHGQGADSSLSKEKTMSVQNQQSIEEKGSDEIRVLSRWELTVELERLARTLGSGPDPKRNGGRACVGLVGYPNVGKSSAINVLVGATPLSHGGVRVSVGATPGKTKHFQTLVLSDSLMLCDCPGLVFPSFVSSTAEMICAGVLPIMQMRDPMPPVSLVARRVPRHILELAYTIKLPVPEEAERDSSGRAVLTAQELLSAFCKARSLFRPRALGDLDLPRGARIVLKDYTDGRLLYCHAPPDLDPTATTQFLRETDKTSLRSTRLAVKLEAQLNKASSIASARVSGRGTGGVSVSSESNNGAGGSTAGTGIAAEVVLESDDIDLMAEALEARYIATEEAVAAGLASQPLSQEGIPGVGKGGAGSGSARSKPTKREMGLLRWGKKGHKVENKNPYDDLSLTGTVSVGAMVAGGGKKGHRGKKRDQFTRVTLPHHHTYQGPSA